LKEFSPSALLTEIIISLGSFSSINFSLLLLLLLSEEFFSLSTILLFEKDGCEFKSFFVRESSRFAFVLDRVSSNVCGPDRESSSSTKSDFFFGGEAKYFN